MLVIERTILRVSISLPQLLKAEVIHYCKLLMLEQHSKYLFCTNNQFIKKYTILSLSSVRVGRFTKVNNSLKHIYAS